MPMDLRTWFGSLQISKPLTVAEPDVGFRIVQSMLMVVVLPAPFGPRSPKISPDSTAMSNLSTAVRPLNDFDKSWVSITFDMTATS